MYETMSEEGGHNSKHRNVQNERVKLNLTQGGEHHQHHPHPRPLPLVNEPISHGSSRQWFGYKGLRGGAHPIWTLHRKQGAVPTLSKKKRKTRVVELEEELTFWKCFRVDSAPLWHPSTSR